MVILLSNDFALQHLAFGHCEHERAIGSRQTGRCLRRGGMVNGHMLYSLVAPAILIPRTRGKDGQEMMVIARQSTVNVAALRSAESTHPHGA
jgi:hypothetical protein